MKAGTTSIKKNKYQIKKRMAARGRYLPTSPFYVSPNEYDQLEGMIESGIPDHEAMKRLGLRPV